MRANICKSGKACGVGCKWIGRSLVDLCPVIMLSKVVFFTLKIKPLPWNPWRTIWTANHNIYVCSNASITVAPYVQSTIIDSNKSTPKHLINNYIDSHSFIGWLRLIFHAIAFRLSENLRISCVNIFYLESNMKHLPRLAEPNYFLRVVFRTILSIFISC